MDKGSDEKLVHFNVGGKRYTTLRSTLLFFKNSTLAHLVGQDYNGTDVIEIDRDGKLFARILNCYRNRCVYRHDEVGLSKREWHHELAYFGLELEAPKPVQIRKRPIDVVEGLAEEKKRKKNSLLATYEPVILWMISQYPTCNMFMFPYKWPDGMVCPEGLPKEVFELDCEVLNANAKSFKQICLDNKIHLTQFHRTSKRQNTMPPDNLIADKAYDCQCIYIIIEPFENV